MQRRLKRGRQFSKTPGGQVTEELEVLERLFEIVSKYRTDRPAAFVEYQTPDELKQLLNLSRESVSADWDAVFNWVQQYLKYSVKTNHPRFLNRMWSGANLPSIIGEIVAAISNTSAGTFESAPVSTLMEQYMIEEMLDLVGFPDGEGTMTTGSSNANMIAMMTARNRVGKTIKEKGLFASAELFAFTSRDAHYSMDNAANILGIGSDHLIKIPVDERGQMDVPILAREMEAVKRLGGTPFFVGATAGTTVRGAYDPVVELLQLRERYKFWLHVDGAWGGAAIFSDELRSKFLQGITDVDSFTWDFHKMAGTALICNVLLLRNGAQLKASLNAGDTSYIYGSDDRSDDLNPGTASLQCGRRVDSLKWFLDWKYYGRRGLAEQIEAYYALCEFAEALIQQSPELELVAPRESFNLCFRFIVPDGIPGNAFNKQLRSKLHKQGVGLVGSGYIDDQFCLRLLIANPEVGQTELVSFFKDLVTAGNNLLKESWTP